MTVQHNLPGLKMPRLKVRLPLPPLADASNLDLARTISADG